MRYRSITAALALEIRHGDRHRGCDAARRDHVCPDAAALVLRRVRSVEGRSTAPEGDARRPPDDALGNRMARDESAARLDQYHIAVRAESRLDRFTLAQPLDSDPGTKWAYNSGGGELMAEVIRSASHRAPRRPRRPGERQLTRLRVPVVALRSARHGHLGRQRVRRAVSHRRPATPHRRGREQLERLWCAGDRDSQSADRRRARRGACPEVR